MSARELITEHLDLWTGAVTKKSSSGRGSNGKVELTGVKKLRELILELAVRGRLVEQDPREEPAHLILERLDSNVKKSKGKQRTSCVASQPSLPTGWACFRVGDYLDFQYGKSLPAKQRDDSGRIEVYGSNGVVGFHTKALTEEPCLVVGRKGSAGALNKALSPSWTTDVAYYVQPPQGFDFEFTYLLLQSLHLDQLGKGIKPGVNRNEAYALPASLPPQEEQHRIVQKVDELMALCDRLEQQTSDQLEAHETLVDTLLGTLTQSANATELADNWARLAAHFDTLFTTEQSIDKLKQTILQLAVMGRLVEQSPSDTQALDLLKAIQREKDRLIESKRFKKPKALPAVSVEEQPYTIPEGWLWSRIGSISLYTEYGTSAKTLDSIHGIPVVKMGDIQDGNVLIGRQKHAPKTTEGIHALLLQQGDLLYNRTNSPELVGKTGIFKGPDNTLSFASYLIRIKVEESLVSAKFLNLAMNSPLFRETEINPHLKQQCGQANVNGTILKQMRVPLPPREEQTRIVQKVDELMALCDKLKERLNQASATRNQLADAVVQGALN